MDTAYQVRTSDEANKRTAQSPWQDAGGMNDSLQPAENLRRIQGRVSPGLILAITISGIAIAEVIAMIVVYFFRSLPYYLLVALDAAVMSVIIFPLLYLLSFRPLLLQLQQRYRAESIVQARLRLMQFAHTHTLNELLQVTLDEIEALTGSTISFFHFLEADQKTLWLQAWSTNTLQNLCRAEGKDRHYSLEQAGVWADCAHQRQPVVHNDVASLPASRRKGLPEGHAPVIRELAVPILRAGKIVAILGVGNKPHAYAQNDVELVSTLADFAWDIVENKRAEDAVRRSEEKFRTLVSWTYDWEEWLDPQGNFVYTSPSCERITGYRPEEFIAHPDLVTRLVHPDDRPAYEEHHRVLHDESIGPMNIEYRIVARDGSERWIDHVCRPLFGLDSRYLGRRVSNRDITERKLAEQKIDEHRQRERLLTETIHALQIDIARDLHDTLGQNISFLRMNLEHLSDARWNIPATVQAKLHGMTKVAGESYELVRGMVAVLQPGKSGDPLDLYVRYAEQVAERSSCQIDVASRGNPQQLSPRQMRQIFFIFREALSNIEKYACASQVLCEFAWGENGLTLQVADNGCGFDPNPVQPGEHYGLRFMRERASRLHGAFGIESAPGRGTKITVQVPYAEAALAESS